MSFKYIYFESYSKEKMMSSYFVKKISKCKILFGSSIVEKKMFALYTK